MNPILLTTLLLISIGLAVVGCATRPPVKRELNAPPQAIIQYGDGRIETIR